MTSTLNTLESRLNDICLEDKEQNPDNDTEKWGLSLKELYRLALHFYKEKTGKAIHLSYEDNLKLVAFTQQATHGPFEPSGAPQLGVLDMIGRDRRMAWQHLGAINKLQAMEGFINLLDRLCPSFKPYVEAIKRDKEERLRLEVEERRKQKENMEKELLLQQEQKEQEEIRNREEMQRRQLQDALNQQTFHQFKAYAEKQFPRNPEQQAVLIRQLQNEHYHQYMQQLHAQIRSNTLPLNVPAEENQNINNNTTNSENELNQDETSKEMTFETDDSGVPNEKDQSETEEYSNESGFLSPAKMWTRPDIKAFKADVSAGSGDGVISVGHGDTVTVRVPTHEAGNCIFWEFATDDYDIGFGIYFEWGKPVSNEVTVHISESDDEEELYEEDEAGDDYSTNGDLECGSVQTASNRNSLVQSRPPISIIVPVYRRECQNEVYVGSHNYPGEGVYLLKFDNSFSIWRSKTLYYRVYYER